MTDFIRSASEANPELAEALSPLPELHQKRLWHQLSEKLLQLLQNPAFQKAGLALKLYENFVQKFEEKLKPLSLIQYAVAAAKGKPDAPSAIAFLETVGKMVVGDAEASLLCRLEILFIKVVSNRLEECKVEVEQCKNTLESYQGIMDSAVHSTYYKVMAEYNKAIGNAVQFYDNTLLYLAYTPLETIPVPEQIRLASEVGLAALVADKVYNFGELLQHPIIKTLEQSQFAWLSQLLFAFNSGDIKRYQALAEEKAANHELLQKNATLLNQKIRIMCLMEMVFHRPSENRTITFQEISKDCIINIDQVELLLMRAFSLKVMRGKLDEVNQTVQIQWVQPRVLNKDQITSLKDRLKQWSENTRQTEKFLEDSAPDIFT